MNQLTLDLDTARDQHEHARLQLETIRYQTAAELIRKQNRPLLEHYDVPPDPWRYRDPIDPAQGLRRHRVSNRTIRRDRDNGNYHPFYETEVDLAVMRADARDMQAFFPRVVGALEQLGNYVFGEGFTFTIQGREGVEPPEDLVGRAQAVVDQFLDDNDFPIGYDREIDERSRVDGECFAALRSRPHGVDLEIVEPDNVVEPANKRQLNEWLGMHGDFCWKYGVMRRRRRSRPLAYHLVYDDKGRDFEVLTASHVEHVKRNVIRSAKRGVTDFFSNSVDAKDEHKLRHRTAVGASVQASIAFIREHVQGANQSGIESFVGNNATADYTRETVGQSSTYRKDVDVEQMRAGTIKDIPFGLKYHAGPLGTLRSPVFIEVAAFLVRALGSRWSMPEYMISSDASNANFASTLVAESPFVKARERDQGFYKRVFRNLLWKVLKIEWGRGRLGNLDWSQIRGLIELSVECPEVASRDKQQQATTDQILVGMGVKSRRAVAAGHDLDFDEQQQHMQEDGDPPPPESAPLGAIESMIEGVKSEGF